MTEIKWLSDPEEHDYPAAISFLNLLFKESKSNNLVACMRKENISYFKAKDIVRAANLPMLNTDNRHVAKNLNKISAGKSISPVLLVRCDGDKLIISDGYHRCCAVYLYSEDAIVPCKIVDIENGD